MTDRAVSLISPQIGRRALLQGILASFVAGCGPGGTTSTQLPAASAPLPSPTPTPSPTATAAASTPFTKNISEFGQDADALQRAFDWAHEQSGSLVLDVEVTVRKTVYLGNLHLINGPGKISVIADEAYGPRPDAGTWGLYTVILMRSSPGNSAYSEKIETQYLVKIEPNCRLEFVRSSEAAPAFPVHFTGLAEGSYINFDFLGRCLIEGECNGPDWWFFNRCRIGGTYRLEFIDGSSPGGFWFRDRDQRNCGAGFGSDFFFDNPVFTKVGGHDECVAIFTAEDVPGRLRARGSFSVDQSSSVGLSIYNDAGSPPVDFDVSLDTIKVRSSVINNQAVVKVFDGQTRIAALEATVTGVEGQVQNAAALRCYTGQTGTMPIITQAHLSSEGAGSAGFPGVKAVWGDCALGAIKLSGLPM